MRTHRAIWLAVLILVSAALVYGVDQVSDGFTFADATVGTKVEIPGKFTDEGVRNVLLVTPGKPEVEALRLPAEVSGDNKDKLTFSLTNEVKPGERYFVRIKLGTEPSVNVGELRIRPLAEAPVSVTAVRPVSSYPNPNPVPNPAASPVPSPNPPAGTKQYDFEIAGANFSPLLSNNHIEIDNCPISTPPCVKDGPIPCLGTEPGNETRKLIVYFYTPSAFSRPLSVSVRVGDSSTNVAKAPQQLVFSSVSEGWLRVYALGAFAILVAILFILVRAGIKRAKTDRGDKLGAIKAFLLDQETNSYSLSKFQLTLFTLVTIFGYIYVFICTMLVQWKFELPAIPENLPGMLAVSLGTTVVAGGIGSRIGGKGAGPESPSLADFISSGGVVLPERFQFFLWTVVSAGGVLALILASDPVTLTQLPKLPDGMLYLMGLSSAGYLGGKLVRGPGPSIKSIDAAKVVVPAGPGGETGYTGLQLALTGDNLEVNASFYLDDERIPADQVKVIEKTDDSQNPKFCSELKVHLKKVADRYFEGTHQLRIVNSDSQGAEIKYGATVDPVSGVVAGQDRVPVKVTGANFKDPSQAVWTPQGGQPTPIPEEDITKVSETELEITLTPGAAGQAKLAIQSPGGLTTTVDVTVT